MHTPTEVEVTHYAETKSGHPASAEQGNRQEQKPGQFTNL